MRIAAPFGALLASFVLPSACMPAAAALQRSEHPYAAAVTEAAQRFAIPEHWIWRVMYAESRGRADAVSHAGAMGLMQIMPGTWASLRARHRLGSDPLDPRANILAGAAYLRAMWDRYRDVRLMLAAYNAGPGRADAYAAGRRRLPAETVAYIASIAPYLASTSREPTAAVLPSPAFDWRESRIFAAEKLPAAGERAAAVLPVSASPEDEARVRIGEDNTLFVQVSGKER